MKKIIFNRIFKFYRKNNYQSSGIVKDQPEEINARREGFALLTHSNESRKLQLAWKAFNSIFFSSCVRREECGC